MPGIEFRPIQVDTLSDDQEGRLIISDERLIGVLVRLKAPEQSVSRGKWSLEVGFGPLESVRPEPFENLDKVRDWILATSTADAERQANRAARR